MGGEAAMPFHVGQEVALLDRRTGEPIEVVRVKEVGDLMVRIEPYTACFAPDGQGLPHEEGEYVGGGVVVDMTGRIIQGPSEPKWVRKRYLPPRHNIRPLTAADRYAIAAREEAADLTDALEQCFRKMSRGQQGRLPLPVLRDIVRLAEAELADEELSGTVA